MTEFPALHTASLFESHGCRTNCFVVWRALKRPASMRLDVTIGGGHKGLVLKDGQGTVTLSAQHSANKLGHMVMVNVEPNGWLAANSARAILSSDDVNEIGKRHSKMRLQVFLFALIGHCHSGNRLMVVSALFASAVQPINSIMASAKRAFSLRLFARSTHLVSCAVWFAPSIHLARLVSALSAATFTPTHQSTPVARSAMEVIKRFRHETPNARFHSVNFINVLGLA